MAQLPVALNRIAVVYREITDLKLDSNNPRLHSLRQVRQIARSIQTFGFNVPILVDADAKVIAGHGRIMAAQLLHWQEVPTIQLAHLNDAQAKAFMIADNRLSENSIWNDRLLAEQLKELSTLELDFSLEVTGFDLGEIDVRIEGLGSEQEGSGDPADDPAQLSTGPLVTRPGDLWLLDRHKVYCASALDEASYHVLMGSARANMVFTDPKPFKVGIEGHLCGKNVIGRTDFPMASGEMSHDEFAAFLTRVCDHLAHHSADGSIHFICMGWPYMSELLAAGRRAYTELRDICVWTKNSAEMGSLYRSQCELIFVYENGDRRHRNNIKLRKYRRNRTNVWHYPVVNSFSRSGAEGNLLTLHPWVMPVALVADAIMDCSARDDLVLDPFLGWGSTLIAAERSGRCCHGLEIDRVSVDTAVRRWQTLTGKSATHARNSRLFSDLEKEMEDSHG
jgi:DNA modification methylase